MTEDFNEAEHFRETMGYNRPVSELFTPKAQTVNVPLIERPVDVKREALRQIALWKRNQK